MNKPLLALAIGMVVTGTAMIVKGIYDLGHRKGSDEAYVEMTALLECKLDEILGNRDHLEKDEPTDGVRDHFVLSENDVTTEVKSSSINMYTFSTNEEEITFPYIELINSKGEVGYLMPFRKYRFQVCGNLQGQIDLGSSPNVNFDDMCPEDRHKWKNAAFSQAMYSATHFTKGVAGWDIENIVWDLVDAAYELYYGDIPEQVEV